MLPAKTKRRRVLNQFRCSAILFGQGTKGAVLGLSEDGSQLTLTQDIDYNAEYKEFRDTLEDFASILSTSGTRKHKAQLRHKILAKSSKDYRTIAEIILIS